MGRIETSPNSTPQMPAGAVEITEAEYDAGVAEWEQSKAEHVETLRAGERAQALGDLRALLDAGVAETTARRLTGTVGVELDEPA